ncbi:UDP-glucose 6-dehydrogenase-like [Eretmochelys imbricata]
MIVQELQYERIHKAMLKPASVFDGRRILDSLHYWLQHLGFQVETIGKISQRILFTANDISELDLLAPPLRKRRFNHASPASLPGITWCDTDQPWG